MAIAIITQTSMLTGSSSPPVLLPPALRAAAGLVRGAVAARLAVAAVLAVRGGARRLLGPRRPPRRRAGRRARTDVGDVLRRLSARGRLRSARAGGRPAAGHPGPDGRARLLDLRLRHLRLGLPRRRLRGVARPPPCRDPLARARPTFGLHVVVA